MNGALRCLLMWLEAPLMSFGAPAVDHRRTVQPWPAASMLTGLFGNALGWKRSDAARLDRLQHRLLWAARIDRPGFALQDFQTAELGKDDCGWTTRGVPEGRAGGANTYDSPHIRYRDFRADAAVAVVISLQPADEAPTVEDLHAALNLPARPLFIGRKACVPATRLALACINADDLLQALTRVPPAPDAVSEPSLYCCDAGLPVGADSVVHTASDERRFNLDLHGGQQHVHQIVGCWPPAQGDTANGRHPESAL